jgi:hypothetical protein
MFSYGEQLNTVKQVRVPEGEHRTIDCPFCGGHKKFTISHLVSGTILWNCFRASCTAKGCYNGQRSINGAKAYLAGDDDTKRKTGGYPIPKITGDPFNYAPVRQYLVSVNSVEAAEKGLIRIRYAPKENRVLFFNRNQTGAVGRLLERGSPKWMTYGDTSSGIHVGTGRTAIIVEDAASACSISRISDFTGVALLGTTITSALKNALQLYDKSYIVLDNDAASKAVALTRQLRGNVSVRVTNTDLKELTVKQIQSLIMNNKNWDE